MSKIWWIVGGAVAVVGGYFVWKESKKEVDKYNEDKANLDVMMQGLEALKRHQQNPDGRAVT